MSYESQIHWMPPEADYRAPDANGHTPREISINELSSVMLTIVTNRNLHVGNQSCASYRDRILTQLLNNIPDPTKISLDLVDRTLRSDNMQFIDFVKIGSLYYTIYRDAVMQLTQDAITK